MNAESQKCMEQDEPSKRGKSELDFLLVALISWVVLFAGITGQPSRSHGITRPVAVTA
jgi:hypothetical protein